MLGIHHPLQIAKLTDENHALQKRIAELSAEIQFYREMGHAITSTLDLKELLFLLADWTKKLIHADLVIVPLIDADNNQYYYAAASGEGSENIIGSSFSLDVGMCGWVLTNREPMLCADGLTQQIPKRTLWEEGQKSAVLVPLVGKSGIIGGIGGLGKGDGSSFTVRDMEVLQLFANTVSPAIDNARLYAQTEFEVEKRTLELRRQTKFMSTVLENITDGVIACNEQGTINLFNRTAAEMLGDALRTLPPQQWTDSGLLMHADGKRPMRTEDLAIVRAIQGETIHNEEMVIQHHDGRKLDLFVSGHPLPNEAGGKLGAVVTLHDNTERKRAEALIMAAREAAEAANYAKSDFLAAMSHEIRTPMNVVLGMAEVLLDGELTADQRHLIEIMHHSGKTLLTVINDVLDFSRIESGRFILNEMPFSPRMVTEETTRLMQAAADEHGLILSTLIDQTIPEAILGDESRVRQVLINLIGNAIKFTHQGGIEVSLRHTPQNPGHLLFTVVDTGIGIATEQLSRIFDKFTQADSGITRRYGGTGLGLTITRQLVELMGGEIWVESHVGQGSRFCFTLPCRFAEIHPVTDKQPTAPLPITWSRSLSILMAEDTLENQILIKTYLRGTPHHLVVVQDGSEALTRVKNEDFDLILMDIQMPRMDGYSATQAIRQLEKEMGRRPMLIFALSAHASKTHLKESLAHGCNDHLIKPISKQTLLQVLHKSAIKLDEAAHSLGIPFEDSKEGGDGVLPSS
ncbi:MAG: response regulator [Magnetococcales bacterium]|nr:response regulator [Magnetococcales bacterium]